MNELAAGIARAVRLILSLDPEVMEITRRSLAISSSSCIISCLVSLPLGGLIHFQRFPGKKILISLIQTLFSLPTVAVGLIVFVLFSRAGPAGGLGFLFTPVAIVIGQSILITPILLGLTLSALHGIDPAIPDTAVSLGASRLQAIGVTLREARYAILTAVVMGFGRAISEVGISLMVGGNIRGFTRTITTAISLETSKGDFEVAFALGIILIVIAMAINIALNQLQLK
jgi:tungstate transport system permease protein